MKFICFAASGAVRRVGKALAAAVAEVAAEQTAQTQESTVNMLSDCLNANNEKSLHSQKMEAQ